MTTLGRNGHGTAMRGPVPDPKILILGMNESPRSGRSADAPITKNVFLGPKITYKSALGEILAPDIEISG